MGYRLLVTTALQCHDTGLYLRVAVRAEQHALAGFGSKTLDRSGTPALREPELLLSRIEVAEVKRAVVAVVAAPRAPTTRLRNELRLLPAPPLRYPLTPAAHGAIVASPFKPKLHTPVATAGELPIQLPLPILLGNLALTQPGRTSSHETVPLQVRASGRDTDAKVGGYLTLGGTCVNQPAQRRRVDRLRREPRAPRRHQSVSAGHLADSRGREATTLADLPERQAMIEETLKICTFDRTMVAAATDRTCERVFPWKSYS